LWWLNGGGRQKPIIIFLIFDSRANSRTALTPPPLLGASFCDKNLDEKFGAPSFWVIQCLDQRSMYRWRKTLSLSSS
jgi:hypothetical protein